MNNDTLRIINITLISFFVVYGIYLGVLYAIRRYSAKTVTAQEFGQDLRKVQLIDLRERDEFNNAHILGARNIPNSQFKARMGEIRKDQPVYLYDMGVNVSGRAAFRLKRAGYNNIVILKGGFDAWNGKIKRK
ncbi:rhodanese-like domain-containing protein [Granulicatella seriolae]|uniref:Rhodanese-like domain-containing protein n=1 Tax=Granulicatella seriolae TaxID=2967226 RepID=A0ABT1WKR6_9LACT|nr:rhodanese-like domain-containing protein [Granulicatella seriolae]